MNYSNNSNNSNNSISDISSNTQILSSPSINEGSIKIKKKKTRNTKHGERNFLCGCNKAYKSYPALYLHIKRKHEGIKPDNTISTRINDPVKKSKTHTGRPHKPILDIDSIPIEEGYLEEVQNDILGYIGEELNGIAGLDVKPSLKEIYDKIQNNFIIKQNAEFWKFLQIIEYTIQKLEYIDINLEDLNKFNEKSYGFILAYIYLWLAKYSVKDEYFGDFSLIFLIIYQELNIIFENQPENPELKGYNIDLSGLTNDNNGDSELYGSQLDLSPNYNAVVDELISIDADKNIKDFKIKNNTISNKRNAYNSNQKNRSILNNANENGNKVKTKDQHYNFIKPTLDEILGNKMFFNNVLQKCKHYNFEFFKKEKDILKIHKILDNLLTYLLKLIKKTIELMNKDLKIEYRLE